eukprot:12721270-Ditylum_brightwellii.AAC.1
MEWKEKVTVVTEDTFPYLDMKMSWKESCLYFLAYHKKNQTIKYVNKTSCHQTAVFQEISEGVFTRSGRLTPMMEENAIAPITELYLVNTAALVKAHLLS